eukprot:TRINITY_DN5689_c0_g1_i1.p1 TRINITY_DN5689_c0_g1~~TRINITY_DN5689_c0_g1_i1.p1  ORF type:complete len:334 (-),score=50.59 TRINITY_DN5689_c0_g1_i1:562-1563(-)
MCSAFRSCILIGALLLTSTWANSCDVISDISQAAGVVDKGCNSTVGDALQALLKIAKYVCTADSIIASAGTFASNHFCSGSSSSSSSSSSVESSAVVVQPMAICSSRTYQSSCTSSASAAAASSYCSAMNQVDCVEDFQNSNKMCLDCSSGCPYAYSWQYTYAAQDSMTVELLGEYCANSGCTRNFGSALYNYQEGYMFLPVSCGSGSSVSPYVLAAASDQAAFEDSVKELTLSLLQYSGLSVSVYNDPVILYNNSLFDVSSQCNSVTWVYIPSMNSSYEPETFAFYDCELYYSISQDTASVSSSSSSASYGKGRIAFVVWLVFTLAIIACVM